MENVMAEIFGQATTSLPPVLMPANFSALERNYADAFVEMHMEAFEKLREANRNWLDRIQLEADLMAEFSTKLATDASIPNVAKLVQELTNRRTTMVTEDAKTLASAASKFMEYGSRLLSSGRNSGK